MIHWVAMVPSHDGKLAMWPKGLFPGNMASTTKDLGNTSQRYGDPEVARANEAFALAALGLDNGARRILAIKPIQHTGEDGDSAKIFVVGHDVPSGACIESDGLIFRGAIAALLRSGDCPPVGLSDSTGVLKGLLHAGKKELKLGVVRDGTRAFGDEFRLNNNDIWAAVAPGIKRCCYRDPKDLSKVVDLQAEILDQLRAAGVDHIVMAIHCTSCSTTVRFPSHRRSDDLGQEEEPEARFTTFVW